MSQPDHGKTIKNTLKIKEVITIVYQGKLGKKPLKENSLKIRF